MAAASDDRLHAFRCYMDLEGIGVHSDESVRPVNAPRRPRSMQDQKAALFSFQRRPPGWLSTDLTARQSKAVQRHVSRTVFPRPAARVSMIHCLLFSMPA